MHKYSQSSVLQRYKVTVGRRYNDFHALHEALIHRYPYRIIPSLPPKKFAGACSPLKQVCVVNEFNVHKATRNVLCCDLDDRCHT